MDFVVVLKLADQNRLEKKHFTLQCFLEVRKTNSDCVEFRTAAVLFASTGDEVRTGKQVEK